MLAGRGHEMTAVSLSPIQIQMAKGFAETAGATVRFIESKLARAFCTSLLDLRRLQSISVDGEKLSFPGEDGSFDAVWISEALSHFPRKDRFFAHAVRLLKPGGKIVVVDWCVRRLCDDCTYFCKLPLECIFVCLQVCC